MRDYVPNGAGYLQGGLQRENWERVITAIVTTSVRKTTHPGINFLIKHVGQLFRRMFGIALEDVKQGEEFSATLRLLPTDVETFLTGEFDEMLWKVMEEAASFSHQSLEPMYSSLNPDLPTFHSTNHLNTNDEQDTYIIQNGQYVKTPSKKESEQNSVIGRIKEKVSIMFDIDGSKAKKMLTEQSLKKASEKSHFLPDERTSMITDEETNLVIKTAFEYIIALTEFNMITLRFQINHYLYSGFKKRLDSWTREVIMKDWSTLVEPDENLQNEIDVLEGKISGLRESLHEVQRMQAKF